MRKTEDVPVLVDHDGAEKFAGGVATARTQTSRNELLIEPCGPAPGSEGSPYEAVVQLDDAAVGIVDFTENTKACGAYHADGVVAAGCDGVAAGSVGLVDGESVVGPPSGGELLELRQRRIGARGCRETQSNEREQARKRSHGTHRSYAPIRPRATPAWTK